MTPDAELRRRLVDTLIDRGHLHDDRVAAAFRAVPRHRFVPSVPLERAYSGEAVITRRDASGVPTSSSSQPGVVATMLEQLELAPGLRVLEIGAGTGYNAALLAWLVRPGAVTTVELQPDVAAEARAHLEAAGFPAVEVRAGDGWLGAADRAPFDRIESTASVRDVAPEWIRQLADGGLLLVPLILRAGGQLLVCFERRAGRIASRSVRGGGFMPLRRPGTDLPGLVHVRGWRVLAEGLGPADLAVLDELLATPPRVEAGVRVGPGAFLRLGLDRDDAISLADDDGWGAFGVFDPAHRSLAALRDRDLLVFGGDDARDPLLAWAARGPDIGSLRFELVPRGSAVASGAIAVLERDEHAIVARGR